MGHITNILRIDASARSEGSITRDLTSAIVAQLGSQGQTSIVTRNVAAGLPFVDETWIGANFTAKEDRSIAQNEKLNLSNDLIEELKRADVIVIGTPIYNFAIPASLKAWIDMIVRARVTFKYTENGPVGLLENKRAIIAVASGGTTMGSEIDFATPYLRHVLKFIGITDVTFIAADALSSQADAKIKEAHDIIAKLKAS